MSLNTCEEIARHPFMWSMGKGNRQSSFIILTVLILLAFQYPRYETPIPQMSVCEPGSTVPNLASGRHSIGFQAAHPVPAPIFHFIWLSVKNAPSLCLPWGKMPLGYFQYVLRTWVISRQFFAFGGPFFPSLQCSMATFSKQRLYPEITKWVPGQKEEMVSLCAHCVAGHKDLIECY